MPAPLLRSLLGLMVVLVLVAAGCTDDDTPFAGDDAPEGTFAPPPSDPGFVVLPPDFVPADSRGVVLTPLEADLDDAEEDPSIAVSDPELGDATISGRVTVDGGGHGARVRLERFVSGKVGVLDVDASADGTFKVEDAIGGRYRVRAWDSPDFSAIPSVTFFMPAEADFTVEVPMRRFEGPRLQVALDTAVPAVGAPARLQALVTEQRVDGEGYLGGDGIEDARVTLTVGSGLRISGANPTSTGSDGLASWQVTCRTTGVHDVTVEYGELREVVSLPACLPAEQASTTSSSSSTTSTTLAPIEVGDTFTVPFTGRLSPGTYVPDEADPTTCSVTYEVRSDGEWSRIEEPVVGVLVLTSQVRGIQATDGTTACTYERES